MVVTLFVDSLRLIIFHISHFFFSPVDLWEGYSLVMKVSKIICEFDVAGKFKGKPNA